LLDKTVNLGVARLALDGVAAVVTQGMSSFRHGNCLPCSVFFETYCLGDAVLNITKIKKHLFKKLELLEASTLPTFTNGSEAVHTVNAVGIAWRLEVFFDFQKVAVQSIQGAEPASG
jgi:hypothetical protein